MSTPERSIVAVGASLGGVEALRSLMGQLPSDFPASVFVVLHVAPSSPGLLGGMLDRAGPLKADLAQDGEPIQRGRVYVAPPDYHLIVADGQVRVVHGPRENRWRPALDPLFRSAAVSYGPRAIGVVLTGYLDDGTAGLLAIKRCGGIAVVQDPADAAVPDMPENALAQVEVDYVVPLAEIGKLLNRLVREPAGKPVPIPRDLEIEAAIMERGVSDISTGEELGEPSVFTCPECGGSLRQVADEPAPRYRCQVGHGYTLLSLLSDNVEAIEGTLWAAIRALEERAALLRRMADFARQRNRSHTAADYERQMTDSMHHMDKLRSLLLNAPSIAEATPSQEEPT